MMSVVRERRAAAVQAPTDEMWNRHEVLLRDLYFNSTLSELMVHMKEELGFIASKNQFERKLKEWNCRKYLNLEERKYILRKTNKRKKEGKKSPAVFFHGFRVSKERLKKDEGRFTLSEVAKFTNSCSNAPSPQGLTVSTPLPSVLEFLRRNIRIDNLPCLRGGFLQRLKGDKSLVAAVKDNNHQRILNVSYQATFQTSGISDLIVNILEKSTANSISEIHEMISRRLQETTIEQCDGDIETRVATIFGQSDADALQEFVGFVIQLGSNDFLDDVFEDTILDWVSYQDESLLASLLDLEDNAVQASLENLVSCAKRKMHKGAFSALVGTDKTRRLYRGRREVLLHIAITLDSCDIVKFLLDGEKLDVNSKFPHLNSDSHFMVARTAIGATRNIKIAELLIEAGADLNTVICDETFDSYGERHSYYTPVYHAACEGNAGLLKLFLNNGASFDTADLDLKLFRRPKSVLACAIERGSIDTVKILLEHGLECVNSLFTFGPGSRYQRTQLQQACYEGETEIVKAILNTESGRRNLLNGRYKWAPLRDAAMEGHLDIVEILIGAGADANSSGEYDFLEFYDSNIYGLRYKLPSSALMAAVEKGHVNVVQSLLGHGADPNAVSAGTYGTNLLTVAELLQFHIITSFLTLKGANRRIKDHSELETDLQFAAARRDLTSVLEVLAVGLHPSHILDCGSDIHEKAGPHSENNVVSIFIEVCGSQVNTRGPKTRSCAVELAIELNDQELVGRLVNAQADFNMMTSHNITPLQLALQYGRTTSHAIIECMLWHGANVNGLKVMSPSLGIVYPPITSAIRYCHQTIVKLLLRTGNCDLKTADSFCILSEAITSEKHDCGTIELLLEYGADINAWDEDAMYETALEASVSIRSLELTKLLLHNGANINALGPNGHSAALLCAALDGSFEMVKLLLDNGANVNAPEPNECYTALQNACSAGSNETAKLLIARGADINALAGWCAHTALQAAIDTEGLNLELIQMLIDKGADINGPPAAESGFTALQAAAMRGYLKIALMLLEKGAEPNAPGSPEDGRTALEAAAQWGRLDMSQLLLNAGAEPTQSAVDFAEKGQHFVIADMIKVALKDKQGDSQDEGKEKAIDDDLRPEYDPIPTSDTSKVWEVTEDFDLSQGWGIPQDDNLETYQGWNITQDMTF